MSQHPLNILIVDDTPANLVALRLLLKKVDANVVEAQSGNKALAATLETDFCLILLDAHMPEMDGYETAEILSSEESTKDIPIIIVTAAYKDDVHRLKSYSSGAIDYIQKPIEESILLSKVKIFLQLYQQKIELKELAEQLEEKVERRTAALQQEIIAREEFESSLRENQKILSRTQRMARIGGWSYSEGGPIIWSDQLLDIFGITQENKPSINELHRIIDPEDIARIREEVSSSSSEMLPDYETEFQFRLPSGTKRTANSIASIIRASDGTIRSVNGAIQDITERKDAELIIKHMAQHDDLTGLPNRNLFHIKIKDAFSISKRTNTSVVVMLIDLDHFKDVNDTLGHQVGDELLQEVALRLIGCCRETDTVARFGGDEFAIITSQLQSPYDAVPLALRCIESIAKEYNLGGSTVHSACSIGLSAFPNDGQDVTKIIKNADVALYRAKDAGRGTYALYNKEMDLEVHQRKSVENDIRIGLEDEQFQLYYQPQMEFGTNKMVGLEALIRWQHPKKGLISPVDFIPIAEKSGLIVEIGSWVLKKACQQLKNWHDMNLDIPFVSVNVSVLQMTKSHFVEDIKEVLAETGLAPCNLELEITESMVMKDVSLTIKILSQLHKLGVSISVDDFGTGFSSLSYLKNLPLTKLKIDQSFVRSIHENAGDAIIAKTIVDLGHNFGLSITAEGVENVLQAEILQDYGCDTAQGYLYSRPMPVSDLSKWIENRRS